MVVTVIGAVGRIAVVVVVAVVVVFDLIPARKALIRFPLSRYRSIPRLIVPAVFPIRGSDTRTRRLTRGTTVRGSRVTLPFERVSFPSSPICLPKNEELRVVVQSLAG